MSETELNEFDRTKIQVSQASNNNNPLTDSEDRFRLVVKGSSYDGTTYHNFLDCHDYLVTKKEEQEEAEAGNGDNARLLQMVP